MNNIKFMCGDVYDQSSYQILLCGSNGVLLPSKQRTQKIFVWHLCCYFLIWKVMFKRSAYFMEVIFLVTLSSRAYLSAMLLLWIAGNWMVWYLQQHSLPNFVKINHLVLNFEWVLRLCVCTCAHACMHTRHGHLVSLFYYLRREGRKVCFKWYDLVTSSWFVFSSEFPYVNHVCTYLFSMVKLICADHVLKCPRMGEDQNYGWQGHHSSHILMSCCQVLLPILSS
jgi:hypothetical protein